MGSWRRFLAIRRLRLGEESAIGARLVHRAGQVLEVDGNCGEGLSEEHEAAEESSRVDGDGCRGGAGLG